MKLIQGLKGAEMNWKNRLTNYNFWISIFSAVLLILQALKIEFDIAYVNEIFTAVLGLLVVIGIISDPTRTSVKSTESSNTKSQTAKIEETQKDKLQTETVAEEIKLPTNEKNEANNVNIKNDIQAILTKISTDLDEKIKQIKQYNLETVNTLLKKESEQISILEEAKKEETSQSNVVETLPAAAEMENPYVDVIN